MARYADDLLEEIRARLDIVAFIGRYVTLKPSGRSFLGLCPFHQEKTPSFNVNRERQFFHCFGCKESGDLFAFVMRYENLTFPEAVERLAAEAGVKLPEVRQKASPEEVKSREKEARSLQANTIAAEYFMRALRSQQARGAVRYLQDRGITGKTVERFHIGYAPAQWQGLLQHLAGHGITSEEAVAAGLAGQREGRPAYDLFRDRIMFPITDLRGRIIAFGGRAIRDEQPKYLNTPQTPLFAKREHLYGLTQARAAVRKAGYVIVCEGYTDVIALAQVGIENSVASLGTAFTREQARLLKKLSSEVVLAFDGDTAGRSAADRGVDLLSEEGLVVRVLLLPDGHDPDSYVRFKGREALLQQLQNAMSLTEYKIEEALRSCDLGTVEGRAQAVEAALPALADVSSPVAREAYVAQIASRVGSSTQAVLLSLEQFLRRTGRRTGDRHRIERSRYTTIDAPVGSSRKEQGSGRAATVQPRAHRGREPALALEERTVLWLLVQEPEQTAKVISILGPRPFAVVDHNALLGALQQLAEGSIAFEELSPAVAQAINDLRAWQPAVLLDLDTYIGSLWEEQMRRRLRRLEVELTRLPERDEDAYAEHVGSLLLAFKRIRQAVRMHGTK